MVELVVKKRRWPISSPHAWSAITHIIILLCASANAKSLSNAPRPFFTVTDLTYVSFQKKTFRQLTQDSEKPVKRKGRGLKSTSLVMNDLRAVLKKRPCSKNSLKVKLKQRLDGRVMGSWLETIRRKVL